MNGFTWWKQNKDKFGLVPALVFWVVSIMCFVFGLAFENPIGFTIAGYDIVFLVAGGLGLANTVVQIIGNDSDREEMGTVMWAGWIASYLFGIGSNVNFLSNTITLSNRYLEIMVCLGLGAMIEILPERLFVTFLRTLEIKPLSRKLPKGSGSNREERHAHFRQQSRPQPSSRPPMQHNDIHPTFHKIRRDGDEGSIPFILPEE